MGVVEQMGLGAKNGLQKERKKEKDDKKKNVRGMTLEV